MASVRRFDYTKTLARAQERIERFGREITFIQLSAGPSDPTKPWQGSTDARATPVSTLTLFGVFVEPESLERLGRQRASGDFIKSAEQVIIVSTSENLGKFDEVVDSDGASYKIDNIQSLGPG